MNTKLPAKPKNGWGSLEPDKALSEDTIKLLQQLSVLPRGQLDALASRGVNRLLYTEHGIDNPDDASKSDLVLVESISFNLIMDMVGNP